MSRVLLALIRFYRRRVSPYMGARCRYYPTCSAYAAQAINNHGAFFGVVMAMWRILRCNPFSRGGYDPAPPAGDRQNRARALAAIKR